MALSRVLAVTIAALLAVGGLVACGGDDSSGDVPEGSVAVVGDAEITLTELQDRVAALRRVQKASGGGGQQVSTSAKALEQQALSTLLLAAALEQEAKARGVEVTDAEVRKTWEGVAARQFKDKKQLRRFLRGQSEQDILDQLRLQVLNERVLADVSEQAGGGKEGEKAARDFQKEFQQRWREKTSCDDSRPAAGMCPKR